MNIKGIVTKGIYGVLIISAIPVILSALEYAMSIDQPLVNGDFSFLILGYAFSLVTTAILFYGCVGIIHFLNCTFTWKRSVPLRILLELFLVFSFTTAAQIGILKSFSYTDLEVCKDLSPKIYFENILFGNTITLIVVILMEGNYFLQQWKQSLVFAEKIKQESIKSQYNSLKSQLDPHFLFNSLNVLSSLIRKDIDKAELFIDDFAKVYRYVLEVKNEMVVELTLELQFLQAYVNLQQIRFGNALELKITLDPSRLKNFVPPLALQELVNNAIKHNEVLQDKPLQIELYNEGLYLVVKNNLQQRKENLESTQLGIENLKKRYALLSENLPEFKIKDQFFIARIPILESD